MGYRVAQWAGMPKYDCKQCAFDSLDLDAMLEHLIERHSVIAITEPVEQPEAPGEKLAEPDEVAHGIYEISLEEVENATNSSNP